MSRKRLYWLLAIVAIAVLVAVQVVTSSHRSQFIAQADIPTVAPGIDMLAGIGQVPVRIRGHDYRRDAFGETWTDDNPAPGGHNGCDTRNDILDRDLVDKTYVAIKRCPIAVATGTLHDPYTNADVAFMRGNQIGASVQIDHIVPLALAWDLGARNWTDDMRLRFANDPANLIAVAGAGQPGQGRSGAGHLDAAQRRRSIVSTPCSSSRYCAAMRCPSMRRRPRCCARPPRRARLARCPCRFRGPAGIGCRHPGR